METTSENKASNASVLSFETEFPAFLEHMVWTPWKNI